MLGTAKARLYRRSVKRWYWVLVYVLVELLVYCTTYILKLAGYLDAAGAAGYWFCCWVLDYCFRSNEAAGAAVNLIAL